MGWPIRVEHKGVLQPLTGDENGEKRYEDMKNEINEKVERVLNENQIPKPDTDNKTEYRVTIRFKWCKKKHGGRSVDVDNMAKTLIDSLYNVWGFKGKERYHNDHLVRELHIYREHTNDEDEAYIEVQELRPAT